MEPRAITGLRSSAMAAEPPSSLPYVAQVVELADRAGARPVLVRSAPGGGADLIVRAAGTQLAERGVAVTTIESVESLGPEQQLAVRAQRRTHVLLLAAGDAALPTHTMQLVAYLRPHEVTVGPLGIEATRGVVDGILGAGSCSDELAATIERATGGRLGDTLDLARHLGPSAPGTPGALPSLAEYPPTVGRLDGAPTDAVLAAWAIAVADAVPALAARCAPSRPLRPIDAVAVRDRLDGDGRTTALRRLCEDAAALDAGVLSADEQVTVATWWCQLADAEPGPVPLTGPELQALLAGVMTAVDLNRWPAAGRIAERLWRTTHVPLAASGVVAALCRAAPTPVLDDILAAHPDDVQLQAVGAFCRALWQLYVEHRPDDARDTLDTAVSTLTPLGATSDDRGMCEDGLATIDLHTGDPDAVERRVGDRPPLPGKPTSFALGALALADLVRGHHGLVLERLDAEVERQLHPGMNLTADRYRFVRSLVLARSGLGDPVERAELADELRRLHEGALRRGDDWNLGWTAWACGQLDARAGRSHAARRRLGTGVGAFGRAHRPGFADWPLATLVSTLAFHDGPMPDPAQVATLQAPAHAIAAERGDALLALAHHGRATGRPQRDVAALLRDAMAVATRQREIVTGHLVAIEQLLLGVTADRPPDDHRADGPVLAACRLALTGGPDEVEQAGSALIELDWSVLGVRLLAHAAEMVRRDDVRRATRLLQTVREVTDTFDDRLRPWVLTSAELPTLSARELEIARAIASGAGRDELAASLVLSRRTIDSHLQRIYTKLGISSRAELREWLDG